MKRFLLATVAAITLATGSAADAANDNAFQIGRWTLKYDASSRFCYAQMTNDGQQFEITVQDDRAIGVTVASPGVSRLASEDDFNLKFLVDGMERSPAIGTVEASKGVNYLSFRFGIPAIRRAKNYEVKVIAETVGGGWQPVAYFSLDDVRQALPFLEQCQKAADKSDGKLWEYQP